MLTSSLILVMMVSLDLLFRLVCLDGILGEQCVAPLLLLLKNVELQEPSPQMFSEGQSDPP